MMPTRRLFTRQRSRRPSRALTPWASPVLSGEPLGTEENSTQAFGLEDAFNELEHLRNQQTNVDFSESNLNYTIPAAERAVEALPATPAVSLRLHRPSRLPAPLSHDPTGWARFAQSNFPTQLFVFAAVLAGGMLFLQSTPQPHNSSVKETLSTSKKHYTSHLNSESFEWLTQLRETNIISAQLEKQFLEAQAFYREYALDEFLEYDPWQLDPDEVITLRHFCDHGFFTAEREILIKLLEQQLLSNNDIFSNSTVTDRLAGAVARQQDRVAGLREAAEIYRRGQDSLVPIHQPLTPEDAQLQRAELVDRLAAVKHVRAYLDSRIAELQEVLKARANAK